MQLFLFFSYFMQLQSFGQRPKSEHQSNKYQHSFNSLSELSETWFKQYLHVVSTKCNIFHNKPIVTVSIFQLQNVDFSYYFFS